jgi:hypothetical protein
VTLSDAPPASPVCGQLWFDTSSPQLYVYYCDPNSSEWVIAAGNGAGGTGVSGSSPFFYIKDFGAKSDGVTDDSAAVNAAVNAAISAGGGLVLLSAGRTVLASPIAATLPATVTITLQGMGPDVSELYFPNATDGLNFTLSYIASPRSWAGVHLRGFSVTRGPTSPVVANTGIRIAKTADALYQGTSSLRDLLVQGSSGFAETNGWNIGILLSSVGGITLDNACILGASPLATSDRGDKLLSIVGGPGPTHPYVASVNIANCYMQAGSCGVDINEYVQGVFINNTTVIAQYDSIRWARLASGAAMDSTHGGEELAVTNCTLNAWHRGIWLSFVNQSQVSNTTILHTGSTPATPWAGIEVNRSGFNSIIGNNVTGSGVAASSETGILLSDCGSGPNAVIGNTCGNVVGYGIWFEGNSTFNVAAGNNLTTTGGTGTGSPAAHGGILEDSPGANTIAGNQWNGLDIPLSRTIVAGHVFVQSTQAQSHQVIYQNVAANNPNRWFAGLIGTSAISDPDNGSNTGSDYQVIASHDDGTIAGPAALSIKRSTNVATLAVAPTIAALPVNAANDAAAAAALVPLNGLYRNGSVLMIRAT